MPREEDVRPSAQHRARLSRPVRRPKAAAKRPLLGRTILVTRPRRRTDALLRRLRALGARVVAAPAIRFAPPRSWSGLDRALARLGGYDAVLFTSANGVERFFARARRRLGRIPPRPRSLYAIGPATAEALEARGWGGVRIPERFEGGALARRLGDVRGRRILIARAAVARDVLPRLLKKGGASVDVVEAYRTIPDPAGRRRIRAAVRLGGIDVVTFTSSSTVEHFVKAAGPAAARRLFRSALAASIGPVTSRALRRRGIRRILEARRYTAADLARAISGLGDATL